MDRLLPFYVKARPNESSFVVGVLQLLSCALNGVPVGVTVGIAVFLVRVVL